MYYILISDPRSGSFVLFEKCPSERYPERIRELRSRYADSAYGFNIRVADSDDRDVTRKRDFLEHAGFPSAVKPKRIKKVFSKSEMNSDMIVDCMKRFGPNLTIVAGEFNTVVYDDRFLQAAKTQLELANELYGGKSPFRLRIICGPIVMIRDEFEVEKPHEATVLRELVDEPNVDIYFSPVRQSEHFRLADHAVYWEDYHTSSDSLRKGYASFYELETIQEYRDKAQRLLENAQASGFPILPVRDAIEFSEHFEFLTESELERLSELAKADDRASEKMRKDELMPYIDQVVLSRDGRRELATTTV